MDKELVFVVGFFWLISAAYVMYYHNKHYELSIETIIWAIFFGPIIALIMKNPSDETVERNIKEHIENDRHRRWFQTRNLVQREMFNRYTIPPPPPTPRKKEFKLLRGYDKNR